MAQISVIVPVYKVEHCIDRCVESILGQTYTDFELILVDDGSPDRSGQICDAYAAKDSRVHVIHQKNAGAAAARNAGLDWAFANSESQWLAFVDSDDWAHPEMLERLKKAAEDFGTDISVCGYGETHGDTPWGEESIPDAEIWPPAKFYQERYINATVPWGKLYRKECYVGERYVTGKHLDDEFLTYRLLFHAERLAVISAPLYAYWVNPEGLTKQPWNPKLLYAWEAYEQQIAFFEARGEKDMVCSRYRHYLENAATNLKAAEESPNAAELKPVIRNIEKRLRQVIRRAWKEGCIEFWFDYDTLYRAYPLPTRIYRLWFDKIRRLGHG